MQLARFNRLCSCPLTSNMHFVSNYIENIACTVPKSSRDKASLHAVIHRARSKLLTVVVRDCEVGFELEMSFPMRGPHLRGDKLRWESHINLEIFDL